MFDFVGKRKIWYIICLCIIIPGIISLCIQGLNVGIDFTGGNITQVKFEEQIEVADIRDVVSAKVNQVPMIQNVDETEFLIRTHALSEEESAALILDLEKNFGKLTVTRSDHIGPVIGSELRNSAILALVIALVLMLIYIAIRFKFNYGITAIITLVNDVLIVLSIFSLLQIEVDGAFIAAILTVIGYSINNTIVIFDRIRENSRGTKKEDDPAIINKSVKQSLARTINTVLAVLFLLVCLMLLGGETTKIFSLAMIVGAIGGLYSAIFLTGSVLHEFNSKKNNKNLNNNINKDEAKIGKKKVVVSKKPVTGKTK
ncbi:MAG: protein translocase subunit SecF [Bacillota bacterium]